jgi:hypothetical protein
MAPIFLKKLGNFWMFRIRALQSPTMAIKLINKATLNALTRKDALKLLTITTKQRPIKQ